jgi:hypothetical protein
VQEAQAGDRRDAGGLGGPQVVQCIVRAVKDNLTFPQPEGGLVTVVYPLTLSPF